MKSDQNPITRSVKVHEKLRKYWPGLDAGPAVQSRLLEQIERRRSLARARRAKFFDKKHSRP